MHLSLKNGHPTTAPVKSIASGLAPPYVGKNNFEIVREYVEEIVLVTDEEIKDSVRVLYENGLVVEPSGAAAFAALRYGKVSNAENKKIVAILSGSNVSPSELVAMFQK
jgi:threonine dehydratase